jgi:YD repeat-containing protein
VAPDGTISTVAGTGEQCSTGGCAGNGDGGPATAAKVSHPISVAAGPDGSVYFAEPHTGRVRRIGPDGIVTTVAGGGVGRGNGIPATSLQLSYPRDVAVGPDGSLYIAEWPAHKVWRVRPDGLAVTAAGTGRLCGITQGCFGGDGGQATKADLAQPTGVDVAPDGTLYIADSYNARIRRVSPDGVITTLAGSGGPGDCWHTGCPDNLPAGQARWLSPHRVAVGPDGNAYVAEGSQIHRIAPILPEHSLQSTVIASQDGQELYVFDPRGRHLETRDALTGLRLQRFAYDGAGRLVSITDRDDRVTRIERDAHGTPTALVAPGGRRTALALDANGHLARVESLGGRAVQLETSGDGLLTGLRAPGGATHAFEYDADGHLKRDTGPAGSQTLTRAPLPGGWSVSIASPLGRTATYGVQRLATGDIRRFATGPGTGTTESLEKSDGSVKTTYADGSTADALYGPDPRFGMQSPIVTSFKTRTPAGVQAAVTGRREVELAQPGNPLSVVRQTDVIVSGSGESRRIHDAHERTITTISPAGRKKVTTLDAMGRVTRFEPGSGLPQETYEYTAAGRLARVVRGAPPPTA